MQVRPATDSDAEEGSEVLRRSIAELCHADHGGDAARIAAWTVNKTPENWCVWTAQQTTRLCVAVSQGRIWGVGMVSDAGEVLLNYVSPDARWQGVSKALLAYLEAEALGRGAGQCTLNTTETARAFYEAAGYRADAGGKRMTKRLTGAQRD